MPGYELSRLDPRLVQPFDERGLVYFTEFKLGRAEAMVYDLNVMTAEKYVFFYGLLDRLRGEIFQIIEKETPREQAPKGKSAGAGSTPFDPPGIKPDELARAISRHELIFREVGQGVCRGVAAGEVFNLETENHLDRFPEGGILVASDIILDADLIRVLKQASALLTDFGKPASHIASLAREHRIPMIVGLTVDAGEKGSPLVGRLPCSLVRNSEQHRSPSNLSIGPSLPSCR